MKGKVFWNVTPCNLVDWCKCFWWTCSRRRACETPGVLRNTHHDHTIWAVVLDGFESWSITL